MHSMYKTNSFMQTFVESTTKNTRKVENLQCKNRLFVQWMKGNVGNVAYVVCVVTEEIISVQSTFTDVMTVIWAAQSSLCSSPWREILLDKSCMCFFIWKQDKECTVSGKVAYVNTSNHYHTQI